MKPQPREILSPSLIIFCSFITRLCFALKTEFGFDNMRLYQQALTLYEHHQISPMGAAVVYSGTALPGALTQILLGVPLFFSQGSLSGSAYWLATLNFLSSLLTYQFYKNLFPKVNPSLLAALILFAPWGLIFTGVWNPSFLPFFGILFLIAIKNLTANQRPILSWSMIGFCIIACMQIHLSFTLLILILFICCTTGIIQPFTQNHIKKTVGGLSLGTLLGSLTLIPYFLYISTPSTTPPGGSDFLIQNIDFSLSKILNYPSYFFRLLSFPSFEISRFILRGTGLDGFQLYMRNHLSLSILLLILEILSLILISFSFRFFLRKRARELLKKLIQNRSLKDASIEERLFFLHWATPIMSGLLFLFSIKSPSAHTYWILMPMSFYPLISEWQIKYPSNRPLEKKFELLIAAVFISLSLLSLQIYLSSNPLSAERVLLQLKSPEPSTPSSE